MRHLSWFRVWQDRLLSDPKFMTMRDSAQGMLLKAWMIAARNAEDGTLHLTAQEFIEHYSSSDYRVAKSDLSTLLSRGYLEDNSGLGLRVLRWTENQETPAATRMRAMRERNKSVTPSVTVTPNVTIEAEAEEEAENNTPLPPNGECARPEAAMSQNDISAFRLGNVYAAYHTHKRHLREKAIECARERLEDGVSPEVIETLYSGGSKAEAPWEKLRALDRPKARAGPGTPSPPPPQGRCRRCKALILAGDRDVRDGMHLCCWEKEHVNEGLVMAGKET